MAKITLGRVRGFNGFSPIVEAAVDTDTTFQLDITNGTVDPQTGTVTTETVRTPNLRGVTLKIKANNNFTASELPPGTLGGVY